MKNKLLWLLKKSDYFDQNIQLSFKDEKRFGTYWGGILSIIIYTTVFVLTLNSVSSLFNKKNPKILITNTYYETAPILNMVEMEMMYASYFMTKDLQPFSDPSYFTYSISQYLVKRDSEGNQIEIRIPLEMIKCSQYEDYYIQKGLENSYRQNSIDTFGICFNNTNVLIGGSFFSGYFSNIIYTIKKCHNETDSEIICKSEEEITQKLIGSYFEFFYVEKNIDANKHQSPFSDYLKSFFILLDPKARKFIDIYIKQINISSDVGLILEEIEFTSSIIFDYFREQVQISNQDNVLIEFYINSSNNILNYDRFYLKFQEFAAVIGGILKVLFFVGSILTYTLTEFKMYDYMINLLFQINEKEELRKRSVANVEGEIKEEKSIFRQLKQTVNNTNKNRKSNTFIKSPIIPIRNINYDFANNLNSSYEKNKNILRMKTHVVNFEENKIIEKIKNKNSDSHVKFLNTYSKDKVPHLKTLTENIYPHPELNENLNEKIKDYRYKLKQKFSLNFISLISIYCCKYCSNRSKRKYDYLRVAFSKLNEYLDYLKIITTLQEFNKLKKIILTKNQRNLFSVYKIPLIDEKKVNAYNFEERENNHNDIQIKYDEVYGSYQIAQEKSGTNKIYRKLLDNFDDRLKMIFNNIEKN